MRFSAAPRLHPPAKGISDGTATRRSGEAGGLGSRSRMAIRRVRLDTGLPASRGSAWIADDPGNG